MKNHLSSEKEDLFKIALVPAKSVFAKVAISLNCKLRIHHPGYEPAIRKNSQETMLD